LAHTLKDIAKELNISISTVSRVVNNKEYVNPKTRKKVLEGLAKHSYVPNQVARSLKKQSTKTIGIVVPDISENFFAQIIKGIDEVLGKHKYSIILVDSDESSEKEEKYLELLYQNRIDGLVLATVSKEYKTLKMYFTNDIPVIFIDNIPDLVEDIDCVIINNKKASEMAINHLVERGNSKIAVIIGSPNETTGYERLDGYKRALEDNNISINESLIKYGNYKENTGYFCMKELLEDKASQPFTAVYIGSEKMTYGAMKAIKEFGLKIPDDIALVGFDVHDKSGLISPGITSIRQPESNIGNIVGDLMINRLKEKNQNGEMMRGIKQRVVLEPNLEIKKSSNR
jgi:LacI family transcriptional regulator